MKLWLLEQTVNNDWDTYDKAVVAAETEHDARMTHPNEWAADCGYDGSHPDLSSPEAFDAWVRQAPYRKRPYSWAFPWDVKVTYIGETHLGAGVVCASFNAG